MVFRLLSKWFQHESGRIDGGGDLGYWYDSYPSGIE